MRFENLETLEISKVPILSKTGAKIYRHPSLFTKQEENLYGLIPSFSTDKTIKINQDLQIRKLAYFNTLTKEIIYSTTIGEDLKSNVNLEKGYYESMGMTEDEFIN
jgi:hypothetical protein